MTPQEWERTKEAIERAEEVALATFEETEPDPDVRRARRNSMRAGIWLALQIMEHKMEIAELKRQRNLLLSRRPCPN